MQSVLAVVDLGKIRQNARTLKKLRKKPLIAVVKDNAYGHGAAAVALALCGIADSFAVATVDEGAALRIAGVSEPILVLTPLLDGADVSRAASYRLTASLGSFGGIKLLKGTAIEAHLTVNTGMNRYGVPPDGVASLCRAAKRAGISITGLYSHLYAPQDAFSLGEQTEAFAKARESFTAFYPNGICHIAATGGALAGVETDAIRVGLALYGYLPDGFAAVPVKPAMKLYAAVSSSERAFGSGAGYQRTEPRKAYHTLRVGYGDGFSRCAPLGIGNLCMDACVREGSARPGTLAELPSPGEYARRFGISVYEVLVNVTKKAVMRYLG